VHGLEHRVSLPRKKCKGLKKSILVECEFAATLPEKGY